MLNRVVLASLAIAGALIAGAPASAQYYDDDGYDGPPRSRQYEEYPGRPRYAPPRYGDDYAPPRRRGGGRWDCNPSRCVDVATGELWESTCNNRGCFPLRPARQRGRGW
jgi:hypothetical protein